MDHATIEDNDSTLILSRCQNEAFEKIKHFLKDDEPAILVNGSAGVGKSTLMKYVVKYIQEHVSSISIAVIAPTHKALRVIQEVLKRTSFYNIPGYTIASILGKIKEHSYIGTKKFSEGAMDKMTFYDLFILDEVSMVCDTDLERVFDYICEANKKIILIGDNCQIPSPSQKFQVKSEYCIKPDSMAFDLVNKITMQEIVRQQQGSVIIQMATYLRDNLKVDVSVQQILNACQIAEERVLVSSRDMNVIYQDIVDDILAQNMSSKIICYTNENVKAHNLQLRRALKRTHQFAIGEVLVGYTNGSNIENGSEYVITQLSLSTSKRINRFSNLVGSMLTLENFYDRTQKSDVFAISIEHPNNSSFMNELIKLAQQVNKSHSTLEDFKNYMKLKRQAVFIEDVYQFDNKIFNEVELKKTHPLLFIPVIDVIDEKKKTIIPSDISSSINDFYQDLLHTRLDDTSKGFTENEVFADMFKIVEKDIYYGYAITSHKAQGSTYDCVYVDENDFVKVKDRWNHKFKRPEHRTKEKNQLRYVAYTRASKKLKIFL